MKAAKRIVIALLIYAALVAAFESLLGAFQPADVTTLVITTTDAQGNTGERVLSRLESEGKLYVAANHWPRRWYRRALAHPEVAVKMSGESGRYRAVAVDAAESARVNARNPTGFAFRVLVGFAPRKFLRLDPL